MIQKESEVIKEIKSDRDNTQLAYSPTPEEYEVNDIRQYWLNLTLFLHTSASSQEKREQCIAVLETTKNFFEGYADRAGPSIIKLDEALQLIYKYNLDKGSLIRIINEQRTSALFTFGKILRFRKNEYPIASWRERMVRNLQLDESDKEVEEIISGFKNANKYLVALKAIELSVQKYNKDAKIVVTGATGSGKSRTFLNGATKLNTWRGTKLDVEKDIIYSDIEENFGFMLLEQEKRILGIDEGAFAANKLEFNRKQVRDLMKAFISGRNRGHIIFTNYIDIDEAATTLLKVAQIWIHKTSLDGGLLFIRNQELPTDDPFGVQPIIKEKKILQKDLAIMRNPAYMTDIIVERVSDDLFAKYDKIKRQKQEEKAQNERLKTERIQNMDFILNKFYNDFAERKFTINTMKIYIKDAYPNLLPLADKYMKEFKRYVIEKAAVKEFKEFGLQEKINGDAIL